MKPLMYLLLVFALPTSAIAATIIVDPAGGGDHTMIQPALDAAKDGDTVLVRPGEYVIAEPLSFNRLHDPLNPSSPPLKNLILRAEKGPAETIIRLSDFPTHWKSMVYPDRVAVVAFEKGETEDSRLEGFTLTGGKSFSWGVGGGVYCSNSSPVISSCRVTGNHGENDRSSGGIICRRSSPTVVGCIIDDNSTGYDNDLGGGIVLSESSPVILDCTIARNWSGSSGGGIACGFGSLPTITNCRIVENTSYGVYCGWGSPARLEGCTIAGNDLTGVYCRRASPVLDHCTITWNKTSGVHCWSASPLLKSCVVWGHRGSSIEIREESSPEVTYSAIENDELWPGVGNINQDPLLCGWGEARDVYVDTSRPGPGIGTADDPYSDIRNALAYSFAFSADSPCRGAGEGGEDMGAQNGTCDAGEKADSRNIHIAPGTYPVSRLDLFHHISLLGAGQDATILEGSLVNLRERAVVSGLTITGGRDSGIIVSPREAPEILDCIIAKSGRSGVECLEGSSPHLSGCLIVGNKARGVVCRPESSPVINRSTIADNGLDRYGAGISCGDSSNVILTNSIVTKNRGSAIFVDSASVIQVTYSAIEGSEVWPGAGNINDDPLFCGWGGATEVYVDESHAGAGDGSQDSPFSTLASAIEGYSFDLSVNSPCRGAGEGGIDMGARQGSCEETGRARLVHLAAGAYPIGGGDLFRNVSLRGAGEDLTVIEGTVLGVVTESTISHLTVTGGTSGGIILPEGESPLIEHCTIRDNRYVGLQCSASSPTLIACTISGNGAADHYEGAGIRCLSSSPVLRGCTIRANGSVGLYCRDSSSPELTDCVISENFGVGVEAHAGASPTLTNCTISDNFGTGVRSGHYSRPVLNHCTITGNVSGDESWSGGVFSGYRSDAVVRNSIVWDNCGGSLFDLGGSGLTVSHSAIEGDTVWPGAGNINSDPLFAAWSRSRVYVDAAAAGPGDGSQANPYRSLTAALGGYSLALSAQSPCLGAADDGTDMGSSTGTSQVAGSTRLTAHLAPGIYPIRGRHLARKISIEGAGQGSTTIEGTVMGLRTGSRLSSLTVTEGVEGGIVASRDEAPEIEDCTITGNSVQYLPGRGGSGEGGGVYCSATGARPTFSRCVISGNEGTGVSSRDGAAPTLVGCTIRGNSLAGVNVRFAEATLLNCRMIGNGTQGVTAHRSSLLMVNCVAAGSPGGGVGSDFPEQSLPQMMNCTVSGNGGRGVSPIVDGTPRLVNCILWGNEVDAIQGPSSHCLDDRDPLFVMNGSFDFDRFKGLKIAGFSFELPDFVVEEPDFHLQPGSPAIKAGTIEGAPETDIEGTPRSCETGVDIGAYERGECFGEIRFRRGDADGNGGLNITDPINVLAFLFLGERTLQCLDAADVDDSGALDLTDALYSLYFQFLGGPPPSTPFPACGSDLTADGLGCAIHPPCE